MQNQADGIFNSRRIVFIIPWFGPIPWYFRFFNKSCSWNPDIDFILITDEEVPGGLADNIKVVRYSLREIEKRFSEKLGFEMTITHPYKFCDLKPAYGAVFSELLKGYDFWGHCDIDLVFGNIRSFITGDILNRYEIITTRREHMAGFFSLYRNNEKINNLFKKSKDYKKVFQEAVDYGFDECNWEYGNVRAGKDILKLNSVVDSMTHVVKNLERTGNIAIYWDHLEYLTGGIRWERGELFYEGNKRVLLSHFYFFKALDFKYVPKWKVIPDRFYMNLFYFSSYAPGSRADLLLRSVLLPAQFIKWAMSRIGQYAHWTMSYLFASRRIKVEALQDVAGLAGNYRHWKCIISIVMVNHRLYATINHLDAKIEGIQFLLLHREAGKFVLAKCKLLPTLINVEFDFSFNKKISAYLLKVTGSGFMKFTFARIS